MGRAPRSCGGHLCHPHGLAQPDFFLLEQSKLWYPDQSAVTEQPWSV